MLDYQYSMLEHITVVTTYMCYNFNTICVAGSGEWRSRCSEVGVGSHGTAVQREVGSCGREGWIYSSGREGVGSCGGEEGWVAV